MRSVLLLLLLLATLRLHSWWDAGHLIIAEIAYQNLTEAKQKEMDELCWSFAPFYPELSTFTTAAIWADIIKDNNALPLFDKYHYINLPYDPNKILSQQAKQLIEAGNEENNVVWVIEKAIQTLNNSHASEFAKALMLRLLIHCVGDIHQPLHCTSLYNKKFRKGDCGGNFFALKGEWTSLHLLWDAGAGAFPQGFYLKEPFDYKSIAQSLMKAYPKQSFPKPSNLSPRVWAQESRQLAIDIAYTIEPNTVPSTEYLEKAQETCRKQVVLAGYRLAEILNQ